MARGVNKVVLIGNLGKDPETRYAASGSAITNITLATGEVWKDKQTGEPQERTEWHRVVFFGRLGEIAGEYLKKGSKVYLEGSLRTRKWQDQSGQDRYTTEIVANELQMLDSRAVSDARGAGHDDDRMVDRGNTRQQPARRAAAASGVGAGHQPSGMDMYDNDIPF